MKKTGKTKITSGFIFSKMDWGCSDSDNRIWNM